MSAKSNAIWRGLERVLHVFGLRRTTSVPNAELTSMTSDATVAPAAIKLFATIELIEAPEPPDGGTPAALPLPVLAQTIALATMYRPSQQRALASQLAYTALRNVPKGRKPAAAPVRAGTLKSARKAALPRIPSLAKAKPVIELARKKKAPKRRHVWLSTQSRVIRVMSCNNVVHLHQAPRTQRTATRSSGQRTVARMHKLAA